MALGWPFLRPGCAQSWGLGGRDGGRRGRTGLGEASTGRATAVVSGWRWAELPDPCGIRENVPARPRTKCGRYGKWLSVGCLACQRWEDTGRIFGSSQGPVVAPNLSSWGRRTREERGAFPSPAPTPRGIGAVPGIAKPHLQASNWLPRSGRRAPIGGNGGVAGHVSENAEAEFSRVVGGGGSSGWPWARRGLDLQQLSL